MSTISGSGPKPITARQDTGPSAPAAAEVAPAPAPAAKPGWVARAQDKIEDTVLDGVQKEREPVGVSPSVSAGGASLGFAGSVKEQLALDSKHPLIAGNADRAAAKDVVWTKLSTAGSVSAGVSVPLQGGVGASFGFSKGAQLSAIVPAGRGLKLDNLTQALAGQAQVLTLNLHPDAIGKYPPGTQFDIAEQPQNFSAGAGVGASGTAGIESYSVGASASASVQKDAYTKSVVVEKDGVVAVRLSAFDAASGSLSVGLDASSNLPGGKLGDLVENRVKITASASASASGRRSLDVGARFDLKTAQGRAAYQYLMTLDPRALETNPLAAQGLLTKLGVGATYSQQTTTAGVAANLRVGKLEALSFSSANRTTKGVLYEVKDGGGKLLESTKLSEAEYTRSVGGFLPRLMMGEERQVAIRLGSVVKVVGDGPGPGPAPGEPTGLSSYDLSGHRRSAPQATMGALEAVGGEQEQRSALLSLSIRDPKVTAAEHQQAEAFARQFGLTPGPAPTQFGNKGTFQTQVAISESGLKKLDAQPRAALEVRFEASLAALQGEEVPWKSERQSKRNPSYRVEGYRDPPSVKARFEEAAKDWKDLQTFGDTDNKREQVLRDYTLTTDRDFEKDLASQAAMSALGSQLDATRGRPVAERAPLLSALGKLSSGDLKAALVMLKDSADAQLLSLNYQANGVTVASEQRVAPASIGELAATALNR